jgi:hypothetical protein
MTTLTLQTQVVPSPDVVHRELDGEAVLLNLGTGMYFGLDEVGTRVWSCLSAPTDLAAIHRTLLDEYEVAADRLEADLIELVGALAERGLVHVADAPR